MHHKHADVECCNISKIMMHFDVSISRVEWIGVSFVSHQSVVSLRSGSVFHVSHTSQSVVSLRKNYKNVTYK